MNLFTIDHIIVYTFLIVTLLVGLYYGRGIKTVREYAVANKEYSTIIITFTLLATALGSGDTIGSVEEIASVGVVFSIASLGMVIGLPVIAYYVLPKFQDKKFKNAISIADVMQFYYGKEVSILTGIVGFLYSVGILGAQITALGYLMQGIFNQNFTFSVAVCGGIIVMYSSLGGIKSVTITDIVQLCVLIVVIPLISGCALERVPEDFSMLKELTESLDKVFVKDNINYLFFFIMCLIPFDWMYPALVQRFLMSQTPRDISKSLIIYALVLMLFIPLITVLAFSAHAMLPNVASKEVFSEFINTQLPNILKGFAIIGFLAVIMSTADSFLNAAGVLIIHNVMKPLLGNLKGELLYMKFVTLMIGIFAIVIAIQQFSIMPLIVFMDGIWGAMVGVPLLMGLFSKKVYKESYWFAIIGGVFSFAYVALKFNQYDYLAPLVAVITSLILFLITNMKLTQGYYSQNLFLKNMKFKKKLPNFSMVFILEKIIKQVKVVNFKNLLFLIKERVKINGINQKLFCIYFWVSLIISIPFWMSEKLYYTPEVTLLIIFSGILSIILILQDIWSEEWLKYYPLYWYITLIVCLPYINTVMFCLNQGDYYESMGLIVSLMILALLVDWFSFLFISLIGIFLGYCHYELLLGDINMKYLEFDNPMYVLIYISLIIILITIIFFRTKDLLVEKKLNTLQTFGGVMAHEVKTPLSSSQSSLNLLEILLNQESKIEGKGDEVEIKLPKANYEALQHALKLMNKSNALGKKTVDMLLMSMKMGGDLQGEKEKLSLENCLNEALEEYGFEDAQQEQIKIKVVKDVEFIGDKEHIKHVFFNLIKNAFKHGGGKVKISIIIGDDKLIFRDNGMGVPDDKLPHIFEDFYTGSNTGTGLGLAFCRRVMESIDGSIKCNSEEFKYTEFVLSFNSVK